MAEQLHMILPPERFPHVRSLPLPPAYEIRTWKAGDDEGWSRLMRAAGFADWGPEPMRVALDAALPEGVFFAVHRPDGGIVATAMAGHNGTVLHPFGGELGWVATDPAHRGHRLGAAVTAEATRRFLAAGYREIYLRTDDFRLPAVKIYLELGWSPLLHLPDMEHRWSVIAAGLGMDLSAMRPVTHSPGATPA